jgi:hypothetical protein
MRESALALGVWLVKVPIIRPDREDEAAAFDCHIAEDGHERGVHTFCPEDQSNDSLVGDAYEYVSQVCNRHLSGTRLVHTRSPVERT